MNTMIRNQQVAGSNPAVGSPSVSTTYASRKKVKNSPLYPPFVPPAEKGYNSVRSPPPKPSLSLLINLSLSYHAGAGIVAA